MIAPDRFDSAPGAHFQYAWGLPLEDAVAIARQRIADGLWRRAPHALMALIQHFRHTRQRPDIESDLLGVLLDDIITVGTFDDAVHGQLAHIVGLLIDAADETRLRDLVTWLADKTQPGEASLVADVLREAHARQDAPPEKKVIPAVFMPLVRRLFLVGASELRAARRAGLLSSLIRAVQTHDPGQLGTALLYFLHSERPAACWILGCQAGPLACHRGGARD